jgi:hypothetical protein
MATKLRVILLIIIIIIFMFNFKLNIETFGFDRHDIKKEIRNLIDNIEIKCHGKQDSCDKHFNCCQNVKIEKK